MENNEIMDNQMDLHVESYSERMQDNGCEGQLTFLPICKKTNYMVVQANSMILGRQNLTLNEAKLVRIVIKMVHGNNTSGYQPVNIIQRRKKWRYS